KRASRRRLRWLSIRSCGFHERSRYLATCATSGSTTHGSAIAVVCARSCLAACPMRSSGHSTRGARRPFSKRCIRAIGWWPVITTLGTTAQATMATNGTRWPAEEIEAALLEFTQAHEGDGTIPFVPSSDCVTAALRDETGDSWSWGITTVGRMGAVAIDLLKRGIWSAPLDDGTSRGSPCNVLRDARKQLHDVMRTFRDLNGEHEKYWTGPATRQVELPPAGSRPGHPERRQRLKKWADDVVAGWPALRLDTDDPERKANIDLRQQLHTIAEEMARILLAAEPALREAAEAA